MNRIYLNVPFIEKEQVKVLGARYDMNKKSWYVEAGRDLLPFQRWLHAEQSSLKPNEGTSVQDSLHTQHRALIDNACNSLSLAELMLQVSTTVQVYHPVAVWVRAEVAHCNQRNGHHYLTLVERDKNTAQEIAKVQAHIWKNRVKIIRDFEKSTKQTLNDSIKILVKCRVKLHIQYGFSLEILEMDDSYTLGHFMQKVAQIRNRLQQQNIIANNTNLPVDTVIDRIAVISPTQAAGLADFKYIMQPIVQASLLTCDYFSAKFQGEEAPKSIMGALEEIQENEKTYQIVMILRGGGGITDLQYLEDYRLLEKICLFGYPIWVGVGHEIDTMTIDEVANKSFITPTALANYLLKRILTPYEEFQKLWEYCHTQCLLLINHQRQVLLEYHPSHKLAVFLKFKIDQAKIKIQQTDLIFQKVKNILFLNQQQLNQRLQKLQTTTQYRMAYYRTTLKHQKSTMYRIALQRVFQQKKTNQKLMQTLYIRLPVLFKSIAQKLDYYKQIFSQNHWQKILKKGYAIVRDTHGKIISQASSLQLGKKYSLQLKDGCIFFKVDSSQKIFKDKKI